MISRKKSLMKLQDIIINNMPRTVIITPNVRQRLKRYIYNITINPSVEPKYKVETFRRAIDKANIILNDLYHTLSNEFVIYKPTQFNVLGKSYGYRQYQYKDKSSKTVWLFGCDTTPSFNFVMIMQNSKLCLSHVEHKGNLIIENKQYNTMKNTRNKVRLTESQLHNVIRESVKKVLSELDWKTYANAANKRYKQFFDKVSTEGCESAREFASKHSFTPLINKAVETSRDLYGGMDDDYDFFTTYGKGGDGNLKMYANAEDNSDLRMLSKSKDGKFYTDGKTKPWVKQTPEKFFGYDNDKIKKFKDFDDDVENYNNGNYDYEPNGRGWHLK